MTDAPEPLTPPDCDLRGFSNLQLDVDLLPKSQLANYADAEAFRAAVLLWCEAWKSVPAASLEDSDMDLRAIVGLQRDGELWVKIKDDALRGFVKCSDGRLYHKTLADKAKKAWQKRLEYRARGKAGAKAKHKHTPDDSEAHAIAAAKAAPKRSHGKLEGEGRSTKGEGEDPSKKPIGLNSTSQERAHGKSSGVFKILDCLGDKDLAAARKAAPGWDIYSLAAVYDEGVSKRGVPKFPDRAFPAWCGSYTGGKPP